MQYMLIYTYIYCYAGSLMESVTGWGFHFRKQCGLKENNRICQVYVWIMYGLRLQCSIFYFIA